jgi:N-acetyltransferase
MLIPLLQPLARSPSNALSDISIEEEYEDSPSEWPSLAHLRLETPEKEDTDGVVRTIPEPKRTVAPPSAKRSRQYFLDLGQADFTHTTCRTCGLVYARGLEGDEKIHNSFHRSQLKGISFKVRTYAS